MTRFTVLLPVHRPPAMLPYAIETVLAQSHADFELFVICDGAPEATVACAREYAARDPRTTVLVFPKGERTGEAHRHVALDRATGEYVAHIADDDLWFPDHLTSLQKLLAAGDFGHVIHVMIHPDGRVEALAADLADPELRQRFLEEVFNRFGLSFGAYRLDAYRRLPEGWAPAPPSVPTDLHMWRKFLRHPGLRYGTHLGVTAVQFATPVRNHMSLEDRARENRQWHARLLHPREREVLEEAAWRSIVAQAVRSDREHAALAVIHARVTAEQHRLEATLARVTAEQQRLEATLAPATVEHQRLEATLAPATVEHQRLEATLARVTAEQHRLEATLARVVQSRSWRWTGPLRSGLEAVRRLGPARRRPDRPGP